MPRVLMAGFSSELRDILRRRLSGYPVSRVSAAVEVREELAGGGVSLLLLDHRIDADGGLRALEDVRADRQWDALPIIYFLSQDPAGELARKLAKDLRVTDVLLSPLDSHEMARRVATALNLTLAQPAGGDGLKIQVAVTPARERFLEVFEERLKVLERAGLDLLESRPSPEARDAARHEAHSLAGLLGTIGFGAGSRFAREMEEILQGAELPGAGAALRYSELLVALRLDVESARPSFSTPRPCCAALPVKLLVIDRDSEFTQRIEMQALARGLCVRAARSFAEAGGLITAETPDVALLDVSLSGNPGEGMRFLESLGAGALAVPAIVLTSEDTLTNRVESARRGGRGFLSRSCSPAQIIEAVLKLVDRIQATDVRIMAVDDDPMILDVMQSLLAPRGILMKTLANPHQFWEEFRSFAPDLLILDADMSGVDGADLCRVVRSDPERAGIPIIFLTHHDDRGSVQRIFSAGADDFVAKPVVGPELLTRIFNRLDRVRMRRSLAETDLLTGTLNYRKSSQMMSDFIELSRKHGQPFSFAAIEVEGLERINHEHGRGAGDTALERIGWMLREAFRGEDVLARWGGGAFVVGMYGLSRYDGVERINELLARIQEKTFQSTAGAPFTVDLSAGIAQFPEDGASIEELRQAARAALHQAKAAGGGKAFPASSGGQPGGTRRIDIALVMRDEAQALLLARALEGRGYRVAWFRDGRTAEKVLAGQDPRTRCKVALMDVDLPGRDGISLLKKLAWDGVLQNTRVIMLTEPSAAEESQTVLELGAFDQVAKPFNPPVVVEHIRRAMDVA